MFLHSNSPRQSFVHPPSLYAVSLFCFVLSMHTACTVQADTIVPYFGGLFKDEPLPKDGWIELDPSKAGFGVTLDKEKLDLRRPYARK